MNEDKIDLYNLDTKDEDMIVYETSLVEDPATGFACLKFSRDGSSIQAFKQLVDESDPSKRMLSGLWFLPDTPLKRYDEHGAYATQITREDLFDAFEKYLKRKDKMFQFNHNGLPLDCVVDIENWIYTEKNQYSPVYGLSIEDLGYNKADIPFGSVFKTVHITDEKFWNDYILSGRIKGFSIGGLFNLTKTRSIQSSEAFNIKQISIKKTFINKMKKNTKFNEAAAIAELEAIATPEVAEAIAELIETPSTETAEEVLDQIETMSIDSKLSALEAKIDEILSILKPTAEKLDVVIEESAATAEAFKKQTEGVAKLAKALNKTTPLQVPATKQPFSAAKQVEDKKPFRLF